MSLQYCTLILKLGQELVLRWTFEESCALTGANKMPIIKLKTMEHKILSLFKALLFVRANLKLCHYMTLLTDLEKDTTLQTMAV